MLLYVIRHERAQRHDLEALGARVVQYLPDEAAAEAATLAGGVDLGMGDGKSPPAPVVSGEADQPPVEPQLVARGLGNVHDLRQLRLGRARRLQLTGRAEIFDQVTGGVGLAGGQVLVKAFALPDNMRAGLEVVEEREDGAGAAEETAVLGLERRDLIAAGAVAQPAALVRPRLDLPRHEADVELRQHLAHRRGERTPLGLIERQHGLLEDLAEGFRVVASASTSGPSGGHDRDAAFAQAPLERVPQLADHPRKVVVLELRQGAVARGQQPDEPQRAIVDMNAFPRRLYVRGLEPACARLNGFVNRQVSDGRPQRPTAHQPVSGVREGISVASSAAARSAARACRASWAALRRFPSTSRRFSASARRSRSICSTSWRRTFFACSSCSNRSRSSRWVVCALCSTASMLAVSVASSRSAALARRRACRSCCESSSARASARFLCTSARARSACACTSAFASESTSVARSDSLRARSGSFMNCPCSVSCSSSLQHGFRVERTARAAAPPIRRVGSGAATSPLPRREAAAASPADDAGEPTAAGPARQRVCGNVPRRVCRRAANAHWRLPLSPEGVRWRSRLRR